MTSFPSSDDSVERRIKALRFWRNVPRLTLIEDGRTNTNFRADDLDVSYFVRCGEDLPHHFVFRQNEAAAVRLAAKIGIAPEVHYASDGYMITDFILGQGLRLGVGIDPQLMEMIARLLRRLHEFTATGIENSFDLGQILNGYLARLGPTLSSPVVQSVKDILGRMPVLHSQCLVHGDLVPNNFIHDGQRLWLIDWEYAGLGHPAVDLAMVASNFELEIQQTQELVGIHGLCSYQDVMALIPVLTAREALWTLVQIERVGHVSDLKEYSELCLRRLKQCS